MIEEPSFSERTENTNAQILATKVGIVGVVLQFFLYVIHVVAQALSIGMYEPSFLLLVVSLLLNPLIFTSGVFISVGFIGVFALKRRGIIGLLFLFYYLIPYNLQYFIPYLPTVVRDILPLTWAILYAVTFLSIIQRVTQKKLLIFLAGMYFVSFFLAPLFNLIWGIWSMPMDTTLDFLIVGSPFIASVLLLSILSIAFLVVESREENTQRTPMTKS